MLSTQACPADEHPGLVKKSDYNMLVWDDPFLQARKYNDL